MLLGHLGAALAARPAAPKARLGVLLVASEGLDLLCYGLVAPASNTSTGLCPSAPRQRRGHQLLPVVPWAADVRGLVDGGRRGRRPGLPGPVDRRRHWPAGRQPLAAGRPRARPDLPLAFDRSPKVGLGLEDSLAGAVHWRRALVVERGLLAAGIAIDRRSRP
jgi:hypothetical protein